MKTFDQFSSIKVQMPEKISKCEKDLADKSKRL